ncbi:VCBS domain-containing protein, partial [Shewanella frigidimarina]
AQQISDIIASFSLDNDDMGWTYDIDNDLLNFLAEGDVITLSFDVTVTDSNGAFDTETVTITINGSNDGPVITPDPENQAGEVIEAGVQPGGNTTENGIVMVAGDLDAIDPDTGDTDNLTWSFTPQPSDYGTFSIDPDTGTWQYLLNESDTDDSLVNQLAYGESRTEIYTVVVTDTNGLTDTQQVTITITGTNDIPELSATQSGTVTEDMIDVDPDRLVATGVITATDVDNNDVLSLDSSYNDDINWQNGANATLSAQQISDIIASFSLDNDDMGWTYDIDNDLLNFLAEGDVITLSFDVTVT